jgi:sigma-B regulation protein RsbU (phosphoserine phosphatase)
MKIRHKLFILLLVLTLAPLVFLRLNNQRTWRQIGQDLVLSSRHMLMDKAREHMLLLVEDHAQILGWQAALLEKALRLQALGLEHLLAGHEQPGATISEAYQEAARNLRGLILAQATVFADGRTVVFPEGASVFHTEPQLEPWYREAVAKGGPVWSSPVLNQATHQIVLTVSAPMRDQSGKILGVTAIMAPVEAILHAAKHYEAVSTKLQAFLVTLPMAGQTQQGLRVVGQQEQTEVQQPHGMGMNMGMSMGQSMMGHMVSGRQWLSPEDPEAAKTLMGDLTAKESGVVKARLDGRESLWAYAPAGETEALVLVAPVGDVLADADQAQNYIEREFATQSRDTMYLAFAVFAAMILVAVLASRAVSRPVSELARAALRLGQGDFAVKVPVRSNDEIGQLAQTFNEVAPHLLDRARLREGLAMAQEIQSSLLPKVLPALPGLELAGRSLYCDETGGDYFDVIENIHGLPGRTGVLLGDVTGHGLPAALLMTTARAFLRLRALQPGDPGQVVSEVNRLLAMDTVGTGRFMTLFYLELAQDRGELRWVRAGHDPAMLYDPTTDTFTDLGGPGLPLGAVEDYAYQDSVRPGLKPGQVLLVGSDGLWEARNQAGEMFGKDRVRAVIRANAHLPAGEVLETLLSAMTAFRGSQPVEDDVTLVVLRGPTEG